MKKFALLSIILILCLNLTSCINITRNIKVNKDGSGSEFVILNFDKTFFDVMMAFATIGDSSRVIEVRDSLYNDDDFISDFKQKLSNVDGLVLKEIYSTTNEDSSKTMYIRYDFDRIDLLGISMGSSRDEVLSGKVTVLYEDQGENLKFSYLQEDSREQETENDSTYANLMEGVAEMFKGKEAVYNIEFSYEVLSSNAQLQDGRLLKWVYQMDDMVLNGNNVYLEAILKKD
ncbi:MAG TPA: hypothetical protein VK004_02485 [Ignavibacteria bacterium]|nr:hypothetical protein [Ignavibacteria bacterium]